MVYLSSVRFWGRCKKEKEKKKDLKELRVYLVRRTQGCETDELYTHHFLVWHTTKDQEPVKKEEMPVGWTGFPQ